MSRSTKLHALQLTDNEIGQLNGRYSEVKSLLGETGELLSARSRLQDAERALSQWRGRQRDQDLALQSLERKKKSSEQKLYGGKIRNPKELSDLQEEIASLDRRKGGIEDKLLETMLLIEEGEAEEHSAGTSLGAIEARWKADQQGLQAERAALEKRLAELNASREEQVVTIPAADLRSYEHLRPRKRGVAVAVLIGAECQGCMTSVSAARVKEARGDTLAFCGTCGRILCALGRGIQQERATQVG